MSSEIFPEGLHGLSSHYHAPYDQSGYRRYLLQSAESEGGAYEHLMVEALTSLDAVAATVDNATDTAALRNISLLTPGYRYEGMSEADATRADGELVIGPLPTATIDMLQQLYVLTGARVIFNDREIGLDKGVVIREAQYLGATVYFEERYDNHSEAWHGQPTFAVQIVNGRLGEALLHSATIRQANALCKTDSMNNEEAALHSRTAKKIASRVVQYVGDRAARYKYPDGLLEKLESATKRKPGV